MIPRLQEPRHAYEVVDIELAHIFYCNTPLDARIARILIQGFGHQAIVKEIKQS